MSSNQLEKMSPAFRISGIMRERAKAGGAMLPLSPRWGRSWPLSARFPGGNALFCKLLSFALSLSLCQQKQLDAGLRR